MVKLLFLLLFVFIVFNINSDDWSRIVNGEQTGYTEFKGVVGLIYDFGDGYISICTASIIDPQILLTAGHCVYKYDGESLVINAVSNPSKMEVRNGANIIYASAIAKVSRIIKHEEWDGVLKTEYFDDINDIALIKLDRKLTDLEIYGLRNDPIEKEGDSGVIVGYGVTGDSNEDGGVHRKGTSEILDMNEFRSKSFTADGISNTCYGDSGGPFFTVQNGEYVVSGVTSYHSGTCTTQNEFVHVLSYRDWIDEKMQELTGHGLDIICGNKIKEAGEVCDKSSKNCNAINSSFPASKSAPCNDICSGYDTSECIVCGDGIKSGSEVCDGNGVDCATLGNYETGTEAPCNSNCTGYDSYYCEAIICGDGVIQSGEVCDSDSKKCEDLGDLPEGRWAPCKYDCSGYETDYCWYPDTAECGNGVVEGDEECDDGNWSDYDSCTTECKKISCGDGKIDDNEECDHSDWYNPTFGYDCTSDCRISKNSGGCSLTVY